MKVGPIRTDISFPYRKKKNTKAKKNEIYFPPIESKSDRIRINFDK